jgi:molecular chaperone Hsp33
MTSPTHVITTAGDHVVRAMTMDGAFRVIAAVTTDTARGALSAQSADGDTALRLAELMTAAVLVRETTNPGRRVQVLWRDESGAALVADAMPDGTNRGMVNPGEKSPVETAGAHVLQVNYTLPRGGLHQGMVAVEEGDDVATALMRYMHESEQTVSMAAVTALPGSDGVRVAGGYLVQLLPEATREAIAEMTDHLGNLPPLARMLEHGAKDARALAGALLAAFEHQELASSPLSFGCTCSEERVILGILGLPAPDVDELLSGGTLEVRCDACGAEYQIEPDRLREVRALGQRHYDA